jgi:hypothetical protein
MTSKKQSFKKDEHDLVKDEEIEVEVAKNQPVGEFQVNGVVSRLKKLSNEYFCEVLRVFFDWKDPVSKSQLKAIHIEFIARGSGSLGLLPDPSQSKLILHAKDEDAVTLTPSNDLSNILSRKICQIHGYLGFDLSATENLACLSSAAIKKMIGKFVYAAIAPSSDDDDNSFTEVFLLFPGSDIESGRCNCPLETCGNAACVEDKIREFHAGLLKSNSCVNCKLEKTGFCNYCTQCSSFICHDCLSGNFSGNDVGKGDCKNHKLYPVQDYVKYCTLCLPGWKRDCDNCHSMVTYNENQLCSYFLHCDSCNFNLCRACSFYPKIKYEPVMIDTSK